MVMDRVSIGFTSMQDPVLEYPRGYLSSLQIFFYFSFETHHKHMYISDDGTETSLGQFNGAPVTNFLWSDISLFNNNPQALHGELSSTLAGLGICSRHHGFLISKIIENVGTATNSVSKNQKVLPLLCRIVLLKTHLYREIPVVDRVVRESRLEYERQNYGMVPTAPESRILKRVKVAGCDSTEICTICLEEIVDFAASMPCAHLFHSNCILEWLKMSHYCPLCRYEMPTET